MRLYEPNPAWDEIEAALEESGGELTPEIEAAMHNAEQTDRQRIDAMIGIVKNHNASVGECKAKAKPFEDEAARWKRKAKTAESKAAWWRFQITRAMLRLKLDKLQTEKGVATVIPGQWSARYDGDPKDLPDEFLKPREFSKQAAIDAAKAGKELPLGVTLERRETVRLS